MSRLKPREVCQKFLSEECYQTCSDTSSPQSPGRKRFQFGTNYPCCAVYSFSEYFFSPEPEKTTRYGMMKICATVTLGLYLGAAIRFVNIFKDLEQDKQQTSNIPFWHQSIRISH